MESPFRCRSRSLVVSVPKLEASQPGYTSTEQPYLVINHNQVFLLRLTSYFFSPSYRTNKQICDGDISSVLAVYDENIKLIVYKG